MKYDNGSEYGFKKLDELFTIDEYKTKSIVIFGMNSAAKMEVAYFHYHDIPIMAIVDNNPKKQGDDYCGVPVLSPSEVLDHYPENIIILVASVAEKSIEESILDFDEKLKNKIYKLDIYDYRKMTNYIEPRPKETEMTLRQVQLELTEMLKWFHDFCQTNHLRYYLHFGTLLGAVRHQGFIPWDNDVDVAMPMKDYKKCCELLSEQDTYHFNSMLNPHQTRMSISVISKLFSKHMVTEYHNYPLQLESEIGIDIFPLSGFPSNVRKQFEYTQQLENLANIWKEKVVMPYDTKRYSKQVHRDMIREIMETMSLYDYESCEYVADVYCDRFQHNFESRAVPRKYYDNAILLPFEGYEFIVASGYDYILKKYYGEYMEIPPKEIQEKRAYNVVYRK